MQLSTVLCANFLKFGAIKFLLSLVVLNRDVVLTKKVWERIQKIAISKQLQLILKQNVQKVSKRRSHAFPPHYIRRLKIDI